ncbi:hypothetical protein BG011_001455, partial [Mortierella polycephala]
MLEAYCNSIDFDALVRDEPNPRLLTLSSPLPSVSAKMAPQKAPKKERQYTARGWMALVKSRQKRKEEDARRDRSAANEANIIADRAAPPTTTTKGPPLSGHSIYMLPLGVHRTAYEVARMGVTKLGGKWLGPATKVLHAKVPALDHTNVTHIVTTLGTLDAVKSLLGVKDIDPKIIVVRAEWLHEAIK